MMSAPAQARDYPFCINGDRYDGAIRYCSFDTYEQCLATASGLKAYCEANPFFAYPEKPRIDYPRKPRRQLIGQTILGPALRAQLIAGFKMRVAAALATEATLFLFYFPKAS